MVIVMERKATEEQIERVSERLVADGFAVHRSTGVESTVLGVIGENVVDERDYELLDGVKEVLRITHPYKLSARAFKPEGTKVRVGEVEIGSNAVVVIAGPCSVENENQINAAAEGLHKIGTRIMRGGAFKPRSSPHSFQGLGEEGLRLLHESARRREVLGTIKDSVDAMRLPENGGHSIGVLGITSYRPFPLAAVAAALKHCKRFVVLEKSLAVGIGGIVATDVRMAVTGMGLKGFTVVTGLGGRAITVKSLTALFEKATREALDPVTFLDLDWKAVNKQLEREKVRRRSGPVAEALLRDVGVVGARNY